jgi:hypothetical protein
MQTARVLLSKGWSVLGVARRPAAIAHDGYRHERLDLGDLQAVGHSLPASLSIRPSSGPFGSGWSTMLRRLGR